MKRTNPVLLTLAIILTSCIIKTPLTAVASLLDRIQADLGLSSSAAGLLNSLPLLAFAIVSLFISQLAQHCGAGRVCFAGMACSAVGILCCAALGKAGLYGGMILIGISIAVGSVLLPAVIKAYFPTKIGPMTSIFATAMPVMPGIAGGVSVPLAKAVSWNFSLGIWAVVALIAMLLWLPNLRCSIVAEQKSTGSAVRRSGISWWITLHCGISALLFYSLLAWVATIVQSKGVDAQTAGFYSSLFVLIGIPVSFVIPILANRMRRQSALGICVWRVEFQRRSAADSGQIVSRRPLCDAPVRCGEECGVELRYRVVLYPYGKCCRCSRVVRHGAEPGLFSGGGRALCPGEDLFPGKQLDGPLGYAAGFFRNRNPGGLYGRPPHRDPGGKSTDRETVIAMKNPAQRTPKIVCCAGLCYASEAVSRAENAC